MRWVGNLRSNILWRISLVELPDKKYSVIYADPPWYFKNFSKKGEGWNSWGNQTEKYGEKND